MFASLILAAATLAAEPAGARADPLQPLRFLVGHCWTGDLPAGAGRDTHCFEPMYGHFIRDRHVVHGKGPDYRGETIFAFDPGRERIVFWYWGSTGAIESGPLEATADGVSFPEHRLTQPRDLVLRTRWKRGGDDRYEAINERKAASGAWTLDWKAVYVRGDGDGK